MARTTKIRLDLLLVRRGLESSRSRAQRAIAEGKIEVDGEITTRSGSLVSFDAEIRIVGQLMPYVSRGALKLERALDTFKIDVKGLVAIDVGASTGGFTQLLLSRGAQLVFAVDVGKNQLHPSLRDDPRVVSFEGVNIRTFQPEKMNPRPSLAVVDVSFISLRLVLPAVAKLISLGGDVVALVKPQFEVGRRDVSKTGIVRDTRLHVRAVDNVIEAAHNIGFDLLATCESPILGGDGNREFLIHLRHRQNEEAHVDE